MCLCLFTAYFRYSIRSKCLVFGWTAWRLNVTVNTMHVFYYKISLSMWSLYDSAKNTKKNWRKPPSFDENSLLGVDTVFIHDRNSFDLKRFIAARRRFFLIFFLKYKIWGEISKNIEQNIKLRRDSDIGNDLCLTYLFLVVSSTGIVFVVRNKLQVQVNLAVFTS